MRWPGKGRWGHRAPSPHSSRQAKTIRPKKSHATHLRKLHRRPNDHSIAIGSGMRHSADLLIKWHVAAAWIPAKPSLALRRPSESHANPPFVCFFSLICAASSATSTRTAGFLIFCGRHEKSGGVVGPPPLPCAPRPKRIAEKISCDSPENFSERLVTINRDRFGHAP